MAKLPSSVRAECATLIFHAALESMEDPYRAMWVALTPAQRLRRSWRLRRRLLSLEAVHDLYFGGNMEASFAFSGQVAGRINEVLPVEQILRETVAECETILREVGSRY